MRAYPPDSKHFVYSSAWTRCMSTPRQRYLLKLRLGSRKVSKSCSRTLVRSLKTMLASLLVSQWPIRVGYFCKTSMSFTEHEHKSPTNGRRIAPKIYEILDTPTPTKTSFVMSFLCRFVEQSKSSGSYTTEISEMCKSILEAAIPGFALRKPEERPSYYGYGREETVREPALNGHDVASVVQHCRKFGLTDCIDRLIGRILQETSTMDTKDFPTTILPLLDSLLSDIKKGEVSGERFRYLFQSSWASGSSDMSARSLNRTTGPVNRQSARVKILVHITLCHAKEEKIRSPARIACS
jgi:hypothetical protein